jgi:hypothetical protein
MQGEGRRREAKKDTEKEVVVMFGKGVNVLTRRLGA